MKIYTKTGDQGQTSLFSGDRVSKSDLRIEAYGTVDELNAYMGSLRDMEVNGKRAQLLGDIQFNLFTMGSLLAMPSGKTSSKTPVLSIESIQLLETSIDEMELQLPPLKHFVLPGGHRDVSFCHIARTVCRRSERAVIRLHEKENLDQLILIYLNRLSDFLFVLSRKMGAELNATEIYWIPRG